MKTLRTALITFGLTSLAYGIFAMLTVAFDPDYAGRSIYRLFSDTGFPMLIVGIACVLAVLLISFSLAAFRGEVRQRKAESDDEEAFLEKETVPAAEYDAQRYAAPQKRQKRRPAPKEQPELPEEFDETMLRSAAPAEPQTQHCIFCGTAFPAGDSVCPKCGRHV